LAKKESIFEELLQRYPALNSCINDIIADCSLITDLVWAGGKILLCGNGGSSADCEHISGELYRAFF
jgi:D-sedoheptulose 7-phosphate isomerase